jgi:hypothetical protein
MAQRIKGQEVTITIVTNGVPQTELTDIQTFHVALNLELTGQGYLGETTDRYDEVFKGAHFDFEMHHHSSDYAVFNQAIVNRARRISPNTVINVSAVLNFPNGDIVTALFPDAFFGTPDQTVPARADYVKTKYDGACSEPQYVIAA